jgi:hypothetical protein
MDEGLQIQEETEEDGMISPMRRPARFAADFEKVGKPKIIHYKQWLTEMQ